MQSEDDQIVPVKDSAKKSARLINGSTAQRKSIIRARRTASRQRIQIKSTPICWNF
jgi:hypothetical protein